MSGASEALARKIHSATDLSSVVRSMKASAASGLGQYERAVESLHEYTRTVELALSVCLRGTVAHTRTVSQHRSAAGIVIFGSDQGLVGRFNETLIEFMTQKLHMVRTNVASVWALGARMEQLAGDAKLPGRSSKAMPYSVDAITPLVGELLIDLERSRASGTIDEIYLVHNEPLKGSTYRPVMTRLLPLDETWQMGLVAKKWPSRALPEVIDGAASALPALVRSYLFVMLFQACAQSLASENASRLAAMQRAQDNISDMLVSFSSQYHRMRQASIDEELFEVVAGFEAQTSHG